MSNGAYKKLAEIIGGKEPRKVIIVTGAPGSGKSTYAKANSKDNSLIVDLDSICSAITGRGVHSDHKKVLDIALKIRNELYQAVESYEGSWKSAYIITASSDKKVINDLKRRFDASEHRMETTKSQCIDRIKNDPDRKGREQVYIDLIEKWFTDMAE